MARRVVSFTVDEDVLSKFRGIVKKESINSSRLVESFIKRYLDDENRKERRENYEE